MSSSCVAQPAACALHAAVPPRGGLSAPRRRRKRDFKGVSLVVYHVPARCGELLVPLYDLRDGVDEVLLADALPPRPDGEHARLGAHAAQVGAGAARTQPGEQLVPNALFHAHGLGVNHEDVLASLRAVTHHTCSHNYVPPNPADRTLSFGRCGRA
ncbi:dual specificity protein phosphatase DSP8, putative [Babesia caballi]|uniref:Dual specificity protein phosphatase DSP8, putative n=1 Tax=Babesia caballi TaxID=5871 RepID=A0AAV4LTC4_BABCB|nr:dual specificity protein phosphatase DSP8, putative [Babesia caballi]